MTTAHQIVCVAKNPPPSPPWPKLIPPCLKLTLPAHPLVSRASLTCPYRRFLGRQGEAQEPDSYSYSPQRHSVHEHEHADSRVCAEDIRMRSSFKHNTNIENSNLKLICVRKYRKAGISCGVWSTGLRNFPRVTSHMQINAKSDGHPKDHRAIKGPVGIAVSVPSNCRTYSRSAD